MHGTIPGKQKLYIEIRKNTIICRNPAIQMVVCSPVERNATIVHDPVIVFEALSPDTTGAHRIVKGREYHATPSVCRYIMLDQDGVSATVYIRSGDAWKAELLVADSILAMPEVGIELPLAELYEGVVFDALEQPHQPPEAESA